MKNTKWRDIIVSLLIGIAFGVVLISFGFNFIAENVRASVLTAIILILITGILIIIVYRNRENAISLLTGIRREDVNSFDESITSLNKAIKDKKGDNIQSSISNLSKIAISKYSEAAFRTWAFRMFFSLLAVFGGVITAGLLLKQNQLIEEEKNLLSAQNQLIENESRYLIEVNKPRIGINTSGATFKENADSYDIESVVNILNYGGREAKNVKTSYTVFEIYGSQCRIIVPKEDYHSKNPIFPEQQVSYVQHFQTSDINASIYLSIDISYVDDLSGEKINSILYYRYPTINQIKSSVKKELGLFNAEESEISGFKDCK